MSVHLRLRERELGMSRYAPVPPIWEISEQRLDPFIVCLNHNMSTSKTPPDIIQEGEKNPRGIPKALFIVRS